MKLKQKPKYKSLVLSLLIFVFIFVIDPIEELHNNLIFAPNKVITVTPSMLGIDFEEVNIKTKDAEFLHGYYLPSKKETDKAFIYFHGNGDNVSCFDLCSVIQEKISINVLIYDYRGYGYSTGKPTRKNAIEDAQEIYRFLINKGFKPENISLYGRSLGGAIALELACKEKIKSLVLESSFTSIKDIAKDLYPVLPEPFIKNDIFNSKELIRKINVPILIVHGTNDEVVKIKHGEELFSLANEPKKFIIYEGAMHNDVSGFFDEKYFKYLEEIFI